MSTKILALMALLLIAGCKQTQVTPKPPDQSVSQGGLQVIVEKSLQNSPTFKEIKRRAKKWDFMIDDVRDGWVRVGVGSISDDEHFFHRWATLKVQTNSGAILKLGTDEKLEDKWLVEFQPAK